MADLFKKIQDLVALQTREDLGQTNVIPSKGLNIVSQTDDMQDNIGLMRWDSFSYLFTRSDEDFIPTLEGRDNFFNTVIVEANDVNHSFTEYSRHGLVISRGEANREIGRHRAWGIRITARQPNSKIVFGVLTWGRVNFSVWVREYNKRGWSYRSIFKHIHNNRIFQVNFDVPVSAFNTTNIQSSESLPGNSVPGTEIWITSYTPPFEDIQGLPSQPAFIAFAGVNLADFIKDWTNLGSYSPVPQWYTPGGDIPSVDANKPLLSTINRSSRNVVNTLNVAIPTIPNWKSINIYRATAESVSNIIAVPTDSNTVVLGNAEPASFASNSNVLLNSDELSDEFDNTNAIVNGVNVSCANKFLNGGENITSDFGSVVNTNPAVPDNEGTLFDFSAHMKFGANSLGFLAGLTATDKKGFFIDSNTLFDIDSFDLTEERAAIHFSFYTSRLRNIHVGTAYAEVRFQCGESPAISDRVYKMDIDDQFGLWDKHEVIFEQSPQTIPGSQLIPSAYTKILIRLYLASSQYSDTFRVWDGFKICRFHKDDIGFGSSGVSTSDGIIVNFSDPMELPRLSSTGYHSYFSTTKSFTGEFLATAYRGGQTTIISDSAYYVDRLKFSKFGKGMMFTEAYRNLIESGDFNGPVDHWTHTAGAESLDSYATTGALFGSSVGRFYTSTDTNRSTYVYKRDLIDIYGSGAVTGDSAFVLSLWAKGREKGTKFWMSLYDSGDPIEQSSKFITLSTSWAKYAVSHQFTDDGNRSSTVRAMISITDQNTVPSEVYIDGIQLTVGVEKGDTTRWGYSYPFDTLSTTDAAEVHSANSIKLHSCHSIMNRNSGTIRFWYTPELDSHSATGEGIFAVNRTFFHQSSASSSIKCFFLSHPTVNSQFNFAVDRGAATETATVSGINFVAHEPIHIVCCWTMSDNASSAWMYVNTAKSNVIEWNGAGTSQSMSIGRSEGASDAANGFICNFRIDTSCWTEEYVRRDFYGTRLTVSTGIGLPRFRYDQIGSINRRGAETQNPITFIDDEGLLPNSQYNYTFSVVDTIGNEGPLSTVKSITSSDMPDFRIHGTSAAPRLIIGQEKTDSAFVRFQPDGLFYHRPGENTAEGVSFMKHSESGVVYGGSVGINTFNRPFENWEGVGFVPNMVVSPYTQVTYLPAHRDEIHGPLCFPYSVKSTGFRIAQRMVIGTPMSRSVLMRPSGTIQAVVGRWDGVTYTAAHDSQRKYDTRCSANSFALSGDGQVGYVVTSLAVPSKGAAMIVNLKTDFFAIGPSQLLYLRMFTNIVNSNTSWPYDQTNWIKQHSERHIWWVNENTGDEAVISMAFSANAMKAKSIAFEISTPGTYPVPPWYTESGGPNKAFIQKNRAFITDLQIMIYDSPVSIINLASARGTVGWTATDGFIDLSIA